MLTTEGILEYLRGAIASGRLAGNTVNLRDAQRVAGFLMLAAEAAGDQATARSFRLLASEAANRQDSPEHDNQRARGA